jgi:hypothetical protein
MKFAEITSVSRVLATCVYMFRHDRTMLTGALTIVSLCFAVLCGQIQAKIIGSLPRWVNHLGHARTGCLPTSLRSGADPRGCTGLHRRRVTRRLWHVLAGIDVLVSTPGVCGPRCIGPRPA